MDLMERYETEAFLPYGTGIPALWNGGIPAPAGSRDSG